MIKRYDFVKLTKAMQKETGETDYLFCVKASWNFVWVRLQDAKIVKFSMKDIDERTVISWRNLGSAYSKFVRQCHPNVTLTLRKYLQGSETTQEIEQYYNYCMAICKKYRVWIKYVYEPEQELPPSKDDEELEKALQELDDCVTKLQKVLAKRRANENE